MTNKFLLVFHRNYVHILLFPRYSQVMHENLECFISHRIERPGEGDGNAIGITPRRIYENTRETGY